VPTTDPTIIIMEKLSRRNQNTSQLLYFLPEMPHENWISINHPNTRNGSPSNSVISENFDSSYAEI